MCPLFGVSIIRGLAVSYCSPVSPTDYVSVEEEVTFAACESQHCVNVRITDDLVNEPEETFSLSLTRSTSTHISFSSVTGEVVVTDDDGNEHLMSLCLLPHLSTCSPSG